MDENCSIVQDLLPLYEEDLLRPETKKYVDAHLAVCSACSEELGKSADAPAPEAQLAPLRGIRRELRRRKLTAVLLAVVLALTLAASGFAYLTAPQYLSLDELDFVFAAESGGDGEALTHLPWHLELDGVDSVQLALLTGVSGMEVEKSFDENGKVIYCVSAWRTLLDEWLGKYTEAPLVSVGENGIGVVAGAETKTIIIAQSLSQAEQITKGSGIRTLTLDTRDCAGIYYSPNNGQENIMLLGAQRDGGMISLPRLALGAYLLLAAGLAAIMGILWFVFRKRKAGAMLGYFSLVPLCYIAGHLLVKGLATESYNMARDFSLIVLVGALVYCAVLLFCTLLREKQGT